MFSIGAQRPAQSSSQDSAQTPLDRQVGFPSLRSTLIAIASLIVYAIAGCLAVHFASPVSRWILVTVAAAAILVIVTSIAFDLRPSSWTRQPSVTYRSWGPNRTTPAALGHWCSLLTSQPSRVIHKWKAAKPIFAVLRTWHSFFGRNRGVASYRRNLANTVFTSFLAIFLTCTLFIYEWYPARNRWILQITSEMKSEIPYPAIAFVSDYPAPYQATILGPQNCYIGNKDTAIPCDSLTSSEVAALGGYGLSSLNDTQTCNCSSNWDREVQPNFIGRDNKPTLHFTPSPNLVAGSVQTFLNLNFSLNINTTQWIDQGYLNGPNLWMLVHDVRTSAEEAYVKGYGDYILVPVDAVTVVTLAPTLLRRRATPEFYSYPTVLSKGAVGGVTCDLGGHLPSPMGKYAECWVLFLVRIQSFEASTSTERREMEWSDFAESLGGYFALVSVICWLVTGLAMTKDV